MDHFDAAYADSLALGANSARRACGTFRAVRLGFLCGLGSAGAGPVFALSRRHSPAAGCLEFGPVREDEVALNMLAQVSRESILLCDPHVFQPANLCIPARTGIPRPGRGFEVLPTPVCNANDQEACPKPA